MFVRKLVCKFSFGGRRGIHAFNTCIVSNKKSLSTNLLREVDDIEKNSLNNSSPWKLQAGVCLIRLPLLEEELNDFEKRYLALKEKLEYESSVLNNWEIEKNRQLELMRDIESGKRNPEEMDFKISQQDYEDDYDHAFKEFIESKVESNPNDMDFANVNRRPKDYLILISKQKLGKDTVWMLPSEEWQENENLRQSAERALESHCGSDVGASFISNAPSGFFKYKFPKEARNDAYVGAKLFIYTAFLPRDSEVKATATFNVNTDNEKMLDFAWVAKDEMRNYLKPKYIKAIEGIVL